MVAIKGADAPAPARRLLGVDSASADAGPQSTLVGRGWNWNTMLDGSSRSRAMSGRGSVVGVVGPPASERVGSSVT